MSNIRILQKALVNAANNNEPIGLLIVAIMREHGCSEETVEQVMHYDQ